MYVCMYVYMYICIYVYIVYMYICIYVYMYICIYVYMYICIYVYMYICIYVYMYICIYVYMYICIYVYMYISITFHDMTLHDITYPINQSPFPSRPLLPSFIEATEMKMQRKADRHNCATALKEVSAWDGFLQIYWRNNSD